MAISDSDLSVDGSGNVRWTGGAVSATQYTVLELHRWLQDKADDAEASGDDLVDITSSTPSDRSTDQIITLNSPFNIDDTVAQHLYGGSVTQAGGDVVYSGLRIDGSVNSATEPMIIQNKVVLPNYWGEGLNADAASNILHRGLVKTRTGGADIDSKRVRIQAREHGDAYFEFSMILGLGEVSGFIQTGNDLNNTTAEATIAGWITIVNNLEGYQQIDLGNGAGDRDYYSEWDKATYTINQFYERGKWYQQRAPVEDSHSGTGKDNTLGNGTITRQGQSFTVGSNAVYLRRVRVRLKIGLGSPSGNITATLYAHSGTYGTSSVGSGSAVATSNAIPASRLRSAYDELEFVFDTPYEMTASTYYVVCIEFTGDASNYVAVDGVDTTGHDGNRCDYTGSWNADSTDDLYFEVYTSPKLYGMPGELFRGITHQWAYDGQLVANMTQNEELTWGSGATAGSGVMIADDDDGSDGIVWIQLTSGVVPTDPMTITGGVSGQTHEINGSVTARSVSPCFLGQSTGSAIIGAFGVGIEATDLSVNDKLFDLTNTEQIPPNNVTWGLSDVEVGDRVLVGPKAAGNDFEYDQYTLDTDLTGGSEVAVVVAETIDSDMPASGPLRILLNSGIRRRVMYTSYTGSTFTIPSTDFSGANQATGTKDVMVSFIDKAAAADPEEFTAIYNTDRALWVRVRDGGGTPIKTFEVGSTLTSAGGGASAIRQSDA